MRLAIIGAGVSAAACVWRLRQRKAQFEASVFEKSRGVGGRMATRRTDLAPFDHGAQYFTVRDGRFQQIVEAAQRDGAVAAWTGRIGSLAEGEFKESERHTPRYVATPAMNALAKWLWQDQPIQRQTRIAQLGRSGGGWSLSDGQGQRHGRFDVVLCSAPAGQTAALMPSDSKLQGIAAAVTMAPCWALMAAFESKTNAAYDGAFVEHPVISWIARNSSKPERNAATGVAETWVVHGSPEWSRENVELASGEAQARLLEAFREATGIGAAPVHSAVHRWMFSIPDEPLESPCLFDETSGLAACGDWCGGPRVEGAVLSGLQVADRIADSALGRFGA